MSDEHQGPGEVAPTAPLAGIRVLDWAEGVAGPYACQLMGDLGADVIKIERPQGDWGRGSGRGGAAGGPHFRALNRNKRNLCLDLRHPDALEVAHRLADNADVMVTAYRPGVTERLGIGYEDFRTRHPDLVYVRVSAYGYSGPLAERPGSDTVLQAVSGLMEQIGDPVGEPHRVGVPVIDYLAARDVTVGVLCALLSRFRGGGSPGPVDVSLFASAATFQAQLWQSWFETGVLPRRTGHRNPSLAPAGLFPTKDGRHVAVAVLRDEHFRNLCAALSLPDLPHDRRFATNASRLQHREELEDVLVPAFRSRTFDEWVPRLLEYDVLAGPVNTFADIETDPGLRAALPVIQVRGAAGTERAIGSPVSVGGRQVVGAASAPALRGQHTRDVLRDVAGYDSDQVRKLVAAGVAPTTDGERDTDESP